MPLTPISGRPFLFCGNLVHWVHNQETKTFEVPIGYNFPGAARFIQLTDWEIIGLPDEMFGPYILLLDNCIVSGTLNDQHGPIVFFSGLHRANEKGPVVQLTTTLGSSLQRLKFTIQLLDPRDETSVMLINLKIAFELHFFL